MKSTIISNIIFAVCWYICTVLNFDNNKPLAIFQLILAIVFTIMAVINYKKYKSEK